jgi:uncharacterized protein (UPF0548 family)
MALDDVDHGGLVTKEQHLRSSTRLVYYVHSVKRDIFSSSQILGGIVLRVEKCEEAFKIECARGKSRACHSILWYIGKAFPRIRIHRSILRLHTAKYDVRNTAKTNEQGKGQRTTTTEESNKRGYRYKE